MRNNLRLSQMPAAVFEVLFSKCAFHCQAAWRPWTPQSRSVRWCA